MYDIDAWRVELSRAITTLECTDDEREALRDALAQETPPKPTATTVVADMLRAYREGQQ